MPAYYPVERIVTSRRKVDIILVKTVSLIITRCSKGISSLVHGKDGLFRMPPAWVAQKDLTPYLLKYGFRTSFYVVRESFL